MMKGKFKPGFGKKIILFPVIIFIFIAGIRAAQLSVFSSRALADHVDGEILVMFKPGVTLKNKMALMVEIGGEEYQDLSFKNMTRVVLEKNMTIPEALSLCKKNKFVAYAQMNFIYRTQAVPNDPHYSEQFPEIQDRDDKPYNPPVEKADLELAWDIVNDCSGITVALADTGINYNHQDLQENMWDGSGSGFPLYGYDFVDNDDNPMDMNGHGTHMAGIIGAAGNNGTGITGLCWRINLMAVRVLDESGKGTTADIAQGLAFAADNGADIITMGFGAEVPYDRALSEALDVAHENEIIAIAAAGNGDHDGKGNNIDRGGADGDEITSFYPCSFRHENLVCAASLDEDGTISAYSNYGAKSVDIAAPGTGIYSTDAGEHEIISDDMASQWILSGGWNSGIIDLGFGSYRMLYNPEDWDKGTYADGTDDRAYKAFNLSAYDAAVLSFYGFINTEAGHDGLNIMINSNGTDPFSEGIRLDSISGESGDNAYLFSYEISDFMSPSSMIGLQFFSDEKQGGPGVGLFRFEISGLKLDQKTYSTMEGTSQAAAHIAGIAALVLSLNINYTASDTVNALISGGYENPQLTKTTSSGNNCDIYGSLLYIGKPSGLTATRDK